MTIATMTSDADPHTIFDLDHYATHGYPHAAWTRLRREDPVHRCEGFDVGPFWAITRYEDIVAIERDSRTFINSPGVTLMKKLDDALPTASAGIPMLLTMDPPQHGKYRAVVRERFRLSAMKSLEAHIVAKCRLIADDVARATFDAAADRGSVDFVTAVAARLPLDVILELLGVPSEDRDQMFIWSNEIIGSEDPEYSGAVPAREVMMRAATQVFGYFAKHVAQRRVAPGDDLVSLLVNARIEGEPMSDFDILGFCLMLMLAGNETTRNATSGSLLTLLDHPDVMKALRDHPDLMPGAVEELLRWVAPIIYMARTATADVVLQGKKISTGDKIVLFYPSANRDESVFADPFRFDVERTPNNHLTFGFGRHLCLGNDLARIELAAVIGEIVRRFPDIRLAGPVARLRSNFVGGIKHMPVTLG